MKKPPLEPEKGMFGRGLDWLRLRFGWRPIRDEVIKHRVTKTPWYYGDGATLTLLFGVLIGTGCFLALDYSPSPATAYDSVVQITSQNTLGWFVRALHYWSAGFMVIMLLYHVLRHLVLGGYLPPREGTWLIGVGIFILTWINAFIGYALRWDERAVYAIRIVLNIAYSVPLIGDELVQLIQGGWTIGRETLSRLYAIHVLFVPFGLSALIGYHVYLVILHGATTVAEQKTNREIETAEEQIALRTRLKESDRTGADFYPHTTTKSGAFALVIFAIVVGLAATLGAGSLYPEANFLTSSVPREEWWFSWFSALAASLPPWLAPIVYLAIPVVTILGMILLPFVDRGENRGLKRRPLAATFVVLLVCGLLFLTSLRIKSPWMAWPRDELPPIPPGTSLTAEVERGRVLFNERGCNTCHAVGGHGSKFGPNLSNLESRLSRAELIRYISQPPESVAMPAYIHRIPPDEIERLAEFVLVVQTFPNKYHEAEAEAPAAPTRNNEAPAAPTRNNEAPAAPTRNNEAPAAPTRNSEAKPE